MSSSSFDVSSSMECGYTKRIEIQGQILHLYLVTIKVGDLGGLKLRRLTTPKKHVMSGCRSKYFFWCNSLRNKCKDVSLYGVYELCIVYVRIKDLRIWFKTLTETEGF